MASPISKTGIRRVTVTETKTVTQLLEELKLSKDHVVLVDGTQVSKDTLIHENDSVVILPLIAGG
ncbi:MAG: MoaD/ThiS family protein [Candidatus Thorarchaeota archaeon]